MPNTNITALSTKLQMRLNDWNNTGAYETDEIEYCLNTAIQETEYLLRCNVNTTEFITSQLTDVPADLNNLNPASYYASDYAEVFEVWCNNAVLQRLSAADLSKLGTYDPTSTDVPIYYWMKGSDIYFWPIPVAHYHFKVSGLKISTAYTGSTDITTIPVGVSEMLILERAESEARRMRLMNSVNPSLHQELYARWIKLLSMVIK